MHKSRHAGGHGPQCLDRLVLLVCAERENARAAVGASGAQEVAVTVKGGYTPDVIVVKAGQPVRLHFTRQESRAARRWCSSPTSTKVPNCRKVKRSR